MDTYETYRRILSLATDTGHAELKLWRETVDAFDAGHLDWHAVAKIMRQSTAAPMQGPGRATVYRRLDQWRQLLVDLDNPGRGA